METKSRVDDVASRTIMFMTRESTGKMLVDKVECVGNDLIDECPLLTHSSKHVSRSCSRQSNLISIFFVLGRHVNTVKMTRIDVDALVSMNDRTESAQIIRDSLTRLSVSNFIERLNDTETEISC